VKRQTRFGANDEDDYGALALQLFEADGSLAHIAWCCFCFLGLVLAQCGLVGPARWVAHRSVAGEDSSHLQAKW